MRLIRVISQSRRDFTGLYKCEGCGTEREINGYDDRNYHDNVEPSLQCKQCKGTSVSLGVEPVHIETKYKEWEQV